MWEPFQWPLGAPPPDRIARTLPTLYRMSDDRLHKPLPASDRPEHYCLKWNNHSSNLVNSLCDQLYKRKDLDGAPFTDVTIVCDDGVRLHAHRLILAASSSNFYDIFKSTSDQSSSNNSHSFVILKDIESSDMKVLLEYMYRGEVTIAQNQLNRLITLAKSLQVRGLTCDLADKAKPNFSDRCSIRDTDTDVHQHELTVSRRWEEQKALKAVADTTKTSLSSETKVFPSPLDSKFSLPISESLKDKLRSRSSTPVSRSHSPSPGHNYLKEESPLKYETDAVKTEPDHRSSTHSHPARSRSPSTCPTSPTYPKPNFELNRDPFQTFQQSYRSNSPPAHQHRINLESSKHLLDYSRNALFLDQQLHHSINKPLAPSPYSDDEIFHRDISPPPSLHQTATSALNLRIPHSTTSPPSPSSPSKRKRYPSSLLPSGVPPPSLLPSSHSHYPSGLQLGSFGLASFPMFPLGYPPLDSLIAKSSYPDVTLRGLSVKKDLGMTEDDKPSSVKRQKLMENGPGFKDFDVNNYLKMSSTPDSFRRHSPSAGLHQLDKRSDGSSPTSTSSNIPVSKMNTNQSSLHPAFSSNNNTTTSSSSHHNSSASIHTNNSDSPYPQHPRSESFTPKGPGGEIVATGAGASIIPSGNSNGSSAPHNTNGGSGSSSYNGQFVNYVGGPKPEWKRYKQYSKSDLMMAIEEVKSGMTALQASRKYKVPSRTLYDKIKKLGITTTPRRNITTGGSNNKLRNHHVKSDYNIHGMSVDHQDGGAGNHSDSVVLGGSSGGGLVSETGVCDSPMASSLAGSSLKADSLMRYDSSRPHSAESSATNDSFHPLDLQVSKATANEINAKLSSASASAAELYSKFPIFKSHVEQLSRYQMESGNRYPHELNSDSRLHHPFAPKSILDMLPRQVDASASETLRSALTDNEPSDLSKRFEYLDQIRAHMGLIQSQVMSHVKENCDSQGPSQSNNLDWSQPPNDGDHHKGNETDDEDSEIVVDTPDEHEKESNNSTELKASDIIEGKTTKSEFGVGSPRVPEGRNDNDTAYISHSTSAATGPSSSDSPPSSSFNMADSGHDSNNDTLTTSDNEGRHQSLRGLKIKHHKSSPEIISGLTPRPSDASPKTSETSISGSDVSPIISDKGQISLESDSEIGQRNSKTSTGSYKVVSEIGLCSQVRPLDLRETSVAMSIPQESV